MSFEIQELPDIIRIIALLSLGKGSTVDKPMLKRRIDKYCAGRVCVEMSDVDETLTEMNNEGLLTNEHGNIKLTERGLKLGKEWRNLLLKREPILEIVAGLTDGSITGLVVIISAFLASFNNKRSYFRSCSKLIRCGYNKFFQLSSGRKDRGLCRFTHAQDFDGL